MKAFWKSTGAKVLAVAALVLIGIMIYAASVGGVTSIPSTVTGVVITPLQNMWSGITGSVVGFFDDLTADSREIERLQAEINTLREQLIDYQQKVQENEFYKQYFEIKTNNPDFQFAAGKVIASDPFDAYHNFTINAGSVNGIRAGNAVITAQGLVGSVYEVGPTWAKVRTVLDPSIQVSAMINRLSENCVTSGSVSLAQQNKLRAEWLPSHSGVTVGDDLVTSGISEKYPLGLLIGKVSSVSASSDGASTNVIIQPYVDFSSISSVMVIVSFENQGGEP